MNLNTCTLRNGSDFQVISQDAPGNCPIVLLADGNAHLLTAELTCPADSNYDLLQHDRRQTRFFNVYRPPTAGSCSAVARSARMRQGGRRRTRSARCLDCRSPSMRTPRACRPR